MTLSRPHAPRQIRVEENSEAASYSANNDLVRKLEWFLCFALFTALLSTYLAQTMAVAVFLASAALLALAVPVRALRAIFSDWLPWVYVALVLVSVSWSAFPDLSARYAIQVTLTAAFALIIARAMEPHSFLSALMCALLVLDVVGLFLGRYALNAGGMAMIGAFGSKNAFSATQALLFLTSCWVLLSANQNIWLRFLALFSVFVTPFLLIAGRSADFVAPLVLATAVTLLVHSTS